MDWDLKMPPWDMAELTRDADSGLGLLVRSSSGLARRASSSGCSVDLKLGGFGDADMSRKWKDQTGASLPTVPPSSSPATVSPSGSSKRARAPGNGVRNVSCLVDECTSDLSNCRDYHRRHKVCEAHSKTPVVMVNGQERRFCQQCSRFHSLVEFDEVKRSCRKRLDGHNRRRRKPQPDTVNMASLFANLQGSPFSSYPQMPSTAKTPNWAAAVAAAAAAVRSEEHCLHGQKSCYFTEKQDHLPASSSSSSLPNGYRRGKQFCFGTSTTETSIPVFSSITSSDSGDDKMLPHGLIQISASDRAPSLLSASPTQTSGIYLENYSHSHASKSFIVSPNGFSRSGIEGAPPMAADASDVALRSRGVVFHVGAEGTSGEASPSQAISFSWQ